MGPRTLLLLYAGTGTYIFFGFWHAHGRHSSNTERISVKQRLPCVA